MERVNSSTLLVPSSTLLTLHIAQLFTLTPALTSYPTLLSCSPTLALALCPCIDSTRWHGSSHHSFIPCSALPLSLRV